MSVRPNLRPDGVSSCSVCRLEMPQRCVLSRRGSQRPWEAPAHYNLSTGPRDKVTSCRAWASCCFRSSSPCSFSQPCKAKNKMEGFPAGRGIKETKSSSKQRRLASVSIWKPQGAGSRWKTSRFTSSCWQ